MGVQEKLDELKAEKKALNKNQKIAEGCLEEYKKFLMLDYSTIEDEIRNSVEVPEYPYVVCEQRPEPVYEEETDNVVEETESVVVADEVGVAADESVDITDKREALSVADEVPERDIVLPVRDYDDDLSDVSVPVIDESMIEISKVTECGKEKPLGEKLISYEEYKRMTPLEKAQTCGVNQIRSRQTVQNIVKQKLMDMVMLRMWMSFWKRLSDWAYLSDTGLQHKRRRHYNSSWIIMPIM